MTQEQKDRLLVLQMILFSDYEEFTKEQELEFEELTQLQLSEIEED